MGRRRARRRGLTEHPGVALLRPTKRRPFWTLRWKDADGQRHQQTTGCQSEGAARDQARGLARRLQLTAGDELDASWPVFSQRYEAEHLALAAPATLRTWRVARDWYTRLMDPGFLSDVTASTASRFTAKLREALAARNGRVREATVAAYLKHLRAAWNWAESVGLLPGKIRVQIPRRARGASKLARSRPITGEEFDRILAAAERTRPADFAQWQRFLRALWESGFRVSELVALSWDPEAPVCLDATGRFPLVRFSTRGEKAHTDRAQPVTPGFWALCCLTRPADRAARIFPLVDPTGRPYAVQWIGRVIGKIGAQAGVLTGFHEAKTATSADIGRRAFATRLGAALSQSDLAEWMRHQSPATTRGYYALPDALDLAGRIWGDGRGSPPPQPASPAAAALDIPARPVVPPPHAPSPTHDDPGQHHRAPSRRNHP